MSREMKCVTMPRRKTIPLHVEAEGVIVNIREGLCDSRGTRVTSIEVICTDYSDETWRLLDSRPRRKYANLRIGRIK